MRSDSGSELRQILVGIRHALAVYELLVDRKMIDGLPLVQEIRTVHVKNVEDIERRLNILGKPFVPKTMPGDAGHEGILFPEACPSSTLSAVRVTEARLRRVYDGVLVDFDFQADRASGRLITTQARRLDDLAWRLSHASCPLEPAPVDPPTAQDTDVAFGPRRHVGRP